MVIPLVIGGYLGGAAALDAFCTATVYTATALGASKVLYDIDQELGISSEVRATVVNAWDAYIAPTYLASRPRDKRRVVAPTRARSAAGSMRNDPCPPPPTMQEMLSARIRFL